VAIFDWDVHYGDGTSQVLYEDDSVLYISIHRFDQGGFYPGKEGSLGKIGDKKGAGFNVQFPFDVVSSHKDLVGDKDYIYACDKVLFPILK
jgi:histone deacetylase 6